MTKYSYNKNYRLRKSRDYSLLKRHGKKYSGSYFVLVVGTGSTNNSRLGLTVSKKVGNAVKRNQVKRIVREYFRVYIKNILEQRDINVIAKKEAHKVSSREMFQDLAKVFGRVINKKICRRME